MADQTNTTRDGARSTRSKQDGIIAELMAEATGKGATFRVQSRLLAEDMEAVHGCKFRAIVDHQSRFILIRPEFGAE